MCASAQSTMRGLLFGIVSAKAHEDQSFFHRAKAKKPQAAQWATTKGSRIDLTCS